MHIHAHDHFMVDVRGVIIPFPLPLLSLASRSAWSAVLVYAFVSQCMGSLLHHSVRVSIKNFYAQSGLSVQKGDVPLVQVGLPQILQNFHAGIDGRFLRSPTHVCTVQLVGAAGFEDMWQKQEDVGTVGSSLTQRP